MEGSFPKSTGQSQLPVPTSGEGGRRVEWVVSQSYGPGLNRSDLPARLRRQGTFQPSNPFFDFGKEHPIETDLGPSEAPFHLEVEKAFKKCEKKKSNVRM